MAQADNNIKEKEQTTINKKYRYTPCPEKKESGVFQA